MVETPASPALSGADPVVHLDGVTVIYGKNRALRNVSARFSPGAVGLLGPNGAGKSTMLKSLLGFIKPAEGRMTVLGLNVAESPHPVNSHSTAPRSGSSPGVSDKVTVHRETRRLE